MLIIFCFKASDRTRVLASVVGSLRILPRLFPAHRLRCVVYKAVIPLLNGAVGGDRTSGLLITNQLLYQLSYNSKKTKDYRGLECSRQIENRITR